MRGTVSEAYEAQDDLVERVHECLAQAIQRTRRGSTGAPVTVAEIYQDLVPYRAIRSSVGFQMNADYEHTLLRLLSGEGGYARLEPSEAREELRSELESPNPNVGLFRKFAACDVYVSPGRQLETDLEPLPEIQPASSPARVSESSSRTHAPEPKPAPARASEPRARTDVPEPEAAPVKANEPGSRTDAPEPETAAPNGVAADVQPAADWESEDSPWEEPALWASDEPELLLEEEVEAADPVVGAENQPEAVAAEPDSSTGASSMYETKSSGTATASPGQACAFCTSALPAGRMVRFCPHCGQDQALQPCRSCQEPLDSAWKFCIACGTTQQS
jgi:hypothetical protein